MTMENTVRNRKGRASWKKTGKKPQGRCSGHDACNHGACLHSRPSR